MKQNDLTPEQLLPTWEAIEHVFRDLIRLFQANDWPSCWSFSDGNDEYCDRLRHWCIETAKKHNYAIPVFPETELLMKGV